MSESNMDRDQAVILHEKAYKAQMQGKFGDAIALYKRSIEAHPTTESYTFLGWTYAMMRRYEEGIEMCHEAIKIDPEFGNPYNDIGSYLIALERWDEAIPWLEKALIAPRYDAPQYPHMNLGRVYEHRGDFKQALASYDRAIAIDPFYMVATYARRTMIARMN